MEKHMSSEAKLTELVKDVKSLKTFFRELPGTLKHANEVKDTLSSDQDFQIDMQSLKNILTDLQFLIDASDSFEQDSRFRDGITSHIAPGEFTHTGWAHGKLLKDQLLTNLITASQTGFSFLCLAANSKPMTQLEADTSDITQRSDHWVSIFIIKNARGELECQYFNPVSGYSHIPDTLNSILGELKSSHPKLKIQSKVNELDTAHIQKKNGDCASLSALYIYLAHMQIRKPEDFSLKIPSDSIMCTLVGERQIREVHLQIRHKKMTPEQALVILTNNGSPDVMEKLRALEFHHYITSKTDINELKAQIDQVCKSLEAILESPELQNYDQRMLVLSLLSIATGIASHVTLITLLGSGGAIYSGVSLFQHSAGNCRAAAKALQSLCHEDDMNRPSVSV